MFDIVSTKDLIELHSKNKRILEFYSLKSITKTVKTIAVNVEILFFGFIFLVSLSLAQFYIFVFTIQSFIILLIS